MGTFTKGAVVLVPFPFSDLSRAKLRPAVILADAGWGDYILCQVTSNPYGDSHAMPSKEEDFSGGSLLRRSYARSTKLFTANQILFVSKAGQLNEETTNQLIGKIVNLLLSKS